MLVLMKTYAVAGAAEPDCFDVFERRRRATKPVTANVCLVAALFIIFEEVLNIFD